jgi:hypothetical protein
MKKISDLIIGKEYFVCLVQDARFAKKYKLLAIINDKDNGDKKKTELHIEHSKGTNILFFHEIGIGRTKMEAKNNFGKFLYEDNPSFSSSYSDVRKQYLLDLNMKKTKKD